MNQSEAWEMHGPRGARRWYISIVYDDDYGADADDDDDDGLGL